MLGTSSQAGRTRTAHLESSLKNSTALVRIVAGVAVMASLGVPAMAQTVDVADQQGFNAALQSYSGGSISDINVGSTASPPVIVAPAAPDVYGGPNGPLTIDFDATRFDVNSGLTLGTGSSLIFNGGAPSTTAGNGYMRIGNAAEGPVTTTVDINGGSLTFNGDGGGNPARLWIGANSDNGEISNATLNMTGGAITFNDGVGGADYGALAIGRDGGVTGVFNQSGGAVTFNGESAIDIGTQGGSGTYSLSGDASFLATDNATLYVGSRTNDGGSAGTVSEGALNIGDDASFTVQSATQVFIGDANATGTVTQSGNSTVSIEASRVFLGSNTNNAGGPDGGGTGIYNLQGGTLNIAASSNEHFVLGHAAGGSGTFNQSGGDFTLTGGLAYGAGSGVFNLDGGTFTVDGITGGNANSYFNFDGGTLIASTSFDTSATFATSIDSASTIEVGDGDTVTWNSAISGTGDLIKEGAGTLALGGANTAFTGNVDLEGGTLALTNAAGLNSQNDLEMSADTVFDLTALSAGSAGGIVQIGELSGSGEVRLGDSYLVSTVGAGQSATFSGTIVSDNYGYQNPYGRFYKAGAGDLLIDNSDMVKGEAYIIDGGSMTMTDGVANWANINVGSGVDTSVPENPQAEQGTLYVSGGELNLSVGLRVGDFGGTGSVEQTGGTVSLAPTCDDDDRCASLNIGNQGGTGEYNISGGELLLNGGSHSIGRNAGSNPAGHGELNISGDALVWLQPVVDGSRGFLVIGDRDAGTQPNSSGEINQTGGTLRIDNESELYLGGYGAGTYNLNDGVLEIGGSSLKGLYGGGGNTTGTYDFNLGGGTIRVLDTALTTSVDAELVAATASTIDTNGLGATWNGVLSGSGDLVKEGLDTLTLGGANTFTGDVELVGGTLALTNNLALGRENDVDVGAGTTFDVSGAPLGVLIGELSGSGNVVLGTKVLSTSIADGQTAAFSGTIQSTGAAWDTNYGKFDKTGGGTLVIDGADMNGGEFYVTGGTLRQSSGETEIDYLDVGTGTTNPGGGPVPNEGELEVSGGSLTLQSLSVGGWGGVGVVNQTGGTVAVAGCAGASDSCGGMSVGNQGGQGTYNISGGVLSMESGGVFNLGRFDNNSRDTSEGVLNISDAGAVRIESGSSLIIGNWLLAESGGSNPTTPGAGDGVITQTGGVLFVDTDSQLYLSAQGDGSYNLLGGVLQIGGTSLIGDYNNGAGTYAFNIGTAELEVTGAALITDVDATLQDGTVFTLNTNNLGATWSGELSGDGGLRKTGVGELLLSNVANSYSGGTYLAGGTLRGSDGTLGTGAIVFEANSTLAFIGADDVIANDIEIEDGVTATVTVDEHEEGTLTGQITGLGGLTKTGAGTLVLDRPSDSDPANDYYGATFIEAGVLSIVGTNALSLNTQVTVGSEGTFELVGVTQEIDELDGDGTVSLGAGSTLTVGGLSGSASINLGAGSELAVGNNGEDTTFSGSLSGEGTFVKEGTGSLVIGPDTDASQFFGPTQIAGGALVVNGSLENSDVTVETGGVLGGSGTVKSVTLEQGAAIGPGNSPGTMTVGQITFGNGSTYEVEFGYDEFGDPISDNILVTTIPDTSGNAVINNGAMLALDVSEGIRIGQGYEIITIESTGSVVQTDDAEFIVDYDAPLLDALVTYGTDAVTVTFSGITAPWSTQVSTRNQGAIANAVQSMEVDDPLYESVVILGEDELNGAFDLLSGEIGASAKGVLINDSQFLRGAIFDRLWSADNSRASGSMSVAPLGYAAPAAAPAPFPVKGEPAPLPPAPASAVWAQGFGSWGSTNGNSNAASLDRDTGGFFIGADTLVNAWRLGVVGGYSSTSFDVDDRASSGDSDNFHLGVYAGTSWDAVRLRLGAAYSWNDVSTTRFASVPFAQTLDADYDAGTAQVFGELGYGFGTAGFDFEPFVGLAYVSLHTDGYTETGGPAALAAGSDTTDVTYTTLGLRGSTTFALGSGLATAKGMLGWRHAFGDVTPLATYAVASGSDLFTVAGLPIAEDAFLVDAGLDFAVSDSITLGIAYGGQFGDGAQDQSVRGTLDWKF